MRTLGLWMLGIGVVVVVVAYASNVSVLVGLVVLLAGLVLTVVGSVKERGTGRAKDPSGPMQATMGDIDLQTGTITSDRGWDNPRK